MSKPSDNAMRRLDLRAAVGHAREMAQTGLVDISFLIFRDFWVYQKTSENSAPGLRRLRAEDPGLNPCILTKMVKN